MTIYSVDRVGAMYDFTPENCVATILPNPYLTSPSQLCLP